MRTSSDAPPRLSIVLFLGLCGVISLYFAVTSDEGFWRFVLRMINVCSTSLLLYIHPNAVRLLHRLLRHLAAVSPNSVLELWATLLPMRVVNEELGDYIDEVNRLRGNGRRAFAWIRTITAVLWTATNTAGYLLRQLGRVRA